jgi:hypothetical protein
MTRNSRHNRVALFGCLVTMCSCHAAEPRGHDVIYRDEVSSSTLQVGVAQVDVTPSVADVVDLSGRTTDSATSCRLTNGTLSESTIRTKPPPAAKTGPRFCGKGICRSRTGSPSRQRRRFSGE